MNNSSSRNHLITFTKLQLVNIYGINVYRNLKDAKEKKKKFWLGVTYAFVVIMMMFYVGAMSYGYVYMGLADILPAYLIVLSSILILLFSIFKSGDIIFQKSSYDIISSFPVKNSTIVISRFIRLYVENVLLAMGAMLPAMVVYGVLIKPIWTFYVIGLVTTMFIPIVPITISVFIGALIKAITARSKHKNFVSELLFVAFFIAIMMGSMKLSGGTGQIDINQIKNILNVVTEFINTIYPPAIWLGNAMLTGDFLMCLGFLAGGLLIFVLIISIVSMNYSWICDGIFGTNAKHNYQMQKLQRNNILATLYKREFKRYFASSIYVTNTIISPISGLLFGVAMLFITPEQMEQVSAEFYTQSGLILQIRAVLPMVLATIFCMMPITSVSISMEGKQWWIIKTMPIRTKDLLDSKLLMNLSIVAPFYGIAVIFTAIGQEASLVEVIWLLLVPLFAMLFSFVLAQTVNIKLAVFDWENEVTVVKQSASSFVGGIVPSLVMLILTFGVMVMPERYTNLAMFVLCAILGFVASMLYRKNIKMELLKINNSN